MCIPTPEGKRTKIENGQEECGKMRGNAIDRKIR
jgi:hypothetical protein